MITPLFDQLRDFSAWFQGLTPFETAMMVMIFWISATIAAVVLQCTVQARRGPLAATLMFGSFMMTALMMALIVFAGLSA